MIQEIQKAYKLFKLRKNGTLGSLFINRRVVLPTDKWMKAECYPTKGYQLRPGWHSTESPHAPHLSTKGRIWMKVEIKRFERIVRPKSQGGVWWLSQWMRIAPS